MPSQDAGSSPAPGSSSGSPDRQAQEAQRAEATSPPGTEQELAQAFRELARGENAATALEHNLTNLEGKIDELLASFERSAAALPPAGGTNGAGSGSGGTSGSDGGGGGENVTNK